MAQKRNPKTALFQKRMGRLVPLPADRKQPCYNRGLQKSISEHPTHQTLNRLTKIGQ